MAPTRRVTAASFGSEQDRRRRRRKPAQPDDVGAPFDLAVEALQGVGGVQLGAMLPGERHVRRHVLLGLVHDRGELLGLGPELVGDLAPLRLGGGIILGEGGGDEGGDDAPSLAAGIREQVAHEGEGGPWPKAA